MHQRGAVPAPPHAVGVEGVLDSVARVRHHVAFKDPGPQLLLLGLAIVAGKPMAFSKDLEQKKGGELLECSLLKARHGDR